MNKPPKNHFTVRRLKDLLVGHYICKVVYYITGWEMFIVLEDRSEIRISTSELRMPDQKLWEMYLSSPAFDLQAGNEPEDTAVAIALFNVLNSFPITNILIWDDGTLELQFSTGRPLLCSGIVDGVDWTWEIDRNGEKLVTCDSGPLFGHPDFVK